MVSKLRNRIVSIVQAVRNVTGFWDRLRVAMRRRAEAYIQARGEHMEYLM
jgi:hypothetical protein